MVVITALLKEGFPGSHSTPLQHQLATWNSMSRMMVKNSAAALQALREMFNGLTWARLKVVPWQGWPDFRRTIAQMDLCIHPSNTETFSIVTADAVAAGVRVVCSHAIEWPPPHWKADPDDFEGMVRVGNALLSRLDGVADGLHALECFQREALEHWLNYVSRGVGVAA